MAACDASDSTSCWSASDNSPASAFGSMATRFVPGGYQPQWADPEWGYLGGEPTVAIDLSDDIVAGGEAGGVVRRVLAAALVALEQSLGDGGGDDGDEVEQGFGQRHHDRADGGQGGDSLFGDSGPDELRSGAFTDIIVPGPGADEVHAGPGDDEKFHRRQVSGSGSLMVHAGRAAR